MKILKPKQKTKTQDRIWILIVNSNYQQRETFISITRVVLLSECGVKEDTANFEDPVFLIGVTLGSYSFESSAE